MDREQAKMAVKRRFAEYLKPAKKRIGGKQTYICPLCNNGTGADGDGLAIDPKGDGTRFKCFKCGFYGDIIDLYQQEHNVDFSEAFSALYDFFKISIDESKNQSREYVKENNSQEELVSLQADFTKYYETCREDVADATAQAYLQHRGISETVADAFFIGYDKKQQRLIIPATKSFYIARAIHEEQQLKYKNPATEGSKVELFNAKALYTDKTHYTYITEGVFDALAFIEAGAEALALNSTSNKNLLLKTLEEKSTEKTLLLCLDNDAQGQITQAELIKELEQRDIDYRECNHLTQPYKDAGEAIVRDRENFVKNVAEDIAVVDRPDNVASYIMRSLETDIEDFKNGADRQTGFKRLDFLSGGIYSGLYVIGGISSVGKTTFAHQLADQMSASGSHVLFFSLEQSRLEMVCKSITRCAARINEKEASTSLQKRKGKTNNTIEQAKKQYIDTTAERMSIVEGNYNCTISFIRKYAEKYIKRNDIKPVIMVDYLQIMTAEVDLETGKKPTDPRAVADYNVVALKRISRDLDIPIFVISSINRSNYLTEIDFECFKESGGIEYTADVIWGLQLQAIHEDIFSQANKINEKRQIIKKAKSEVPRKIELVCLKNRYGQPNYSVNFEYKPQYDLFTEEDDVYLKEQIEPEKLATTTSKRY